MNTQTMLGVIHGKTIELSSLPDLADGLEVEVVIRAAHPTRTPGEGLLQCAGALAYDWTDEDDRILAEIERERKECKFRDIEDDFPT